MIAKNTPIITRSWRKTVTLQIAADGTLHVKAPYLVSQHTIDQFIIKHTDWIAKKRQLILKSSHPKKFQLNPGSKLLFLGLERSLIISNTREIQITNSQLNYPKFLLFRLNQELLNWYKKQASSYISKQVKIIAQEMNSSYGTLTFSDTKSKWGSCTHDNNLQFNWRLIMAPELVIRYVIIHELAHTTIKNHSQSFWSLVEKYTPSYKQQRKWLKNHGEKLHWTLS